MTKQVPKESEFNLETVKLPKNGGLMVEYSYQVASGQDTHEIHDKHETTENPHPDLTAIMRKLKDYLIVVHRMDMVSKIVNQKQFKATDEQKKIADGAMDELKQNIRVNKISLYESAEKRAVIITGVNNAITDQGMALNTHKIHLDSYTYGFEPELSNVVEDLIAECYEFVFNHKIEQPELFENSLSDGENSDSKS